MRTDFWLICSSRTHRFPGPEADLCGPEIKAAVAGDSHFKLGTGRLSLRGTQVIVHAGLAQGGSRESLSALRVSPASPQGAQGEGRRQEVRPDLQAAQDLQKTQGSRGFLGPVAHSPIVSGAEDTSFPSLSLRFIT